MLKIQSIIRFSPNRWFHSIRRGSVLILVVALIVILALLGTAFVATARLDRANASFPVGASIANSQLQSLQNEICNDIAQGLYDQSTGNYRPVYNDPSITADAVSDGVPANAPPTYGHFDSNRWTYQAALAAQDPQWDQWMADRLPALDTSPSQSITWRAVSRLPGRSAANLQTNSAVTINGLAYDPFGQFTTGTVQTYLIPTAITMTYPRSNSENPVNTPKVFPAFLPETLTTTTGNWSAPGTYAPFVAADADGDGIADSLLFSLNVTSPSPQGTITYYAAVRVVDNNSAINLNTAWSRANDFQIGGQPGTGAATSCDALGTGVVSAANLGWLPSHVGLYEALDPTHNQMDITALNLWRFGRQGIVNGTPWDGSQSAGSPTRRGDYQFLTLGDVLYNQLGRRLGNPGAIGGPNANQHSWMSSVSDNGEFAFAFDMLDPNANTSINLSPTYAPSTAEQKLPSSAYADTINSVQNRTYNRWSTYPADKAVYWYDYGFNTANLPINYNYDNEGANASNLTALGTFYRNIRPISVSRNPLSNAAPIHSYYNGAAPANNVAPRQVPVPPPVGALTSAWAQQYMAPYTNPAVTPAPAGAASPIRASLNTDPFPVLWRAFWNVMCDDNHPGPVGAFTGLPSNAAGTTYTAVNQIYTPPPDILTNALAGGVAPYNVTTTSWPRYDQLLIRAAIAAVNVEGLRDPSPTGVISRRIVLPDGLTVEVFSNKPQPYIYAYDNVAYKVTLCNPMKAATVTLNGYNFLYYDPLATTAAPTIIGTVPDGTALGPGTTSPQYTITPPAMTSATGEILLMRTRLATGVGGSPLAASLVLSDKFNESATGSYWDWIPVDFAMFSQPFHRGDGLQPDWSYSMALINPATPTNPILTQIFNDDFPAPYSPSAATAELPAGQYSYPFGEFSRVGDVLKVPFVGSYRVVVPVGVANGTAVGPPTGTDPGGTAPAYFVPVTLDCAACQTGTTGEQIGHFYPVSSDPSPPATATVLDYDWTKKIFDYFTAIQNPGSDSSPNVNPGSNVATNAAGANWSVPLYSGLPPTWPTAGTTNGVTPVANTTGTAGTPNTLFDEDNVGVDGLININTAPWQVLAALPMVAYGTADGSLKYSEANVALAHAIVLWRDGGVVGAVSYPPHGPFKSVFDLNLVTDQAVPVKYTFQNAWGSLGYTGLAGTAGANSTPAMGDFSPYNGTDNVPGDWEKRYLTLTRISNLITTRSDTFTCYIVVQGWLNVGTPNANPILVSQQRSAFIANRVATGPGSSSVQTTSLPTPP